MRQEDFNRYSLQFIFSVVVLLTGWRYLSAYYKSKRRPCDENWLSAVLNSALRWTGSADDSISGSDPGSKRKDRHRGRSQAGNGARAATAARGPASRAEADSAASLEAAAAGRLGFLHGVDGFSGSSDASDSASVASDAEDETKPANGNLDAGEDPPLGLADGHQVRVIHDVKGGQDMGENASAGEALAELAKEKLLGISVWDCISKKNRIRVSGCVRVDNDGHNEALGFVLYRLNQHTLQILYLGVAAGKRRSGLGRMLVRAVRETARREQMCLSIIVLLSQDREQSARDVAKAGAPQGGSNASASAAAGGHESFAGLMGFWRATGFRRSDVKGLADGQVCLKIEVRKLGKKQQRLMAGNGCALSGGGTTLDWPEVLFEAKRNTTANRNTEAVAAMRLPPPPAARRTEAAPTPQNIGASTSSKVDGKHTTEESAGKAVVSDEPSPLEALHCEDSVFTAEERLHFGLPPAPAGTRGAAVRAAEACLAKEDCLSEEPLAKEEQGKYEPPTEKVSTNGKRSRKPKAEATPAIVPHPADAVGEFNHCANASIRGRGRGRGRGSEGLLPTALEATPAVVPHPADAVGDFSHYANESMVKVAAAQPSVPLWSSQSQQEPAFRAVAASNIDDPSKDDTWMQAGDYSEEYEQFPSSPVAVAAPVEVASSQAPKPRTVLAARPASSSQGWKPSLRHMDRSRPKG